MKLYDRLDQIIRKLYTGYRYLIFMVHESILIYTLIFNLVYQVPNLVQILFPQQLQFIADLILLITISSITSIYQLQYIALLRSNPYVIHDYSNQHNNNQSPTLNLKNTQFCNTCIIFKKQNYSHCKYCDKCVVGYDHHSFIFNICIGKDNYKQFMQFLYLLLFQNIVNVVVNQHSMNKVLSLDLNNVGVPILKLALVICISYLVIIVVLIFIVFQYYLILNNVSTVEFNYDYKSEKIEYSIMKIVNATRNRSVFFRIKNQFRSNLKLKMQ